MAYTLIVTGAAGFIGSTLIKHLELRNHVILKIDRDQAFDLLDLLEANEVKCPVIHLGACTDTLCQDKEIFNKLNINYTKKLFQLCAKNRTRLIYASSAATYGDGSKGFSDKTELLPDLYPLNPYGDSKHQVDLWAIDQTKACQAPPAWAGLKFFNVYGANEHKKGKMASMVFQIMQQIRDSGRVKLFKCGEQKRDWVHVDDVCDVISHMLEYPCYGIYNVGSGTARSFNDIALLSAKALGVGLRTEYFDMPPRMIGSYQDYSKADLTKLRLTGFKREMTSLESGILLMAK